MPASPAASVLSLFACAEFVFCKTEVKPRKFTAPSGSGHGGLQMGESLLDAMGLDEIGWRNQRNRLFVVLGNAMALIMEFQSRLNSNTQSCNIGPGWAHGLIHPIAATETRDHVAKSAAGQKRVVQ